MKKMSLFTYINAVFSVLYVLLSFPFQWNVSTLAFPLALVYAGFLIYFTLYELVIKKTLVHLNIARQLIQYEPFFFMICFLVQRMGKVPVFYVQDILQAVVWTFTLILAIIMKYLFLSEKRITKILPEWEKWISSHPAKKYKGWGRVVYEIVTTVDALVWAISVIFLVNIFLVQLYVIPSESMVPTFLVKDRVVTWKTFAGPKLPLSEAGLPDLQNYDRGDVVVFHNPHYSDNRENEIKSTLSNIAFMLTFTLAKTNVDENGNLKADPLVKRITGIPGEQLMLMDGNLYARTKESNEFKVVEKDKQWAAWNLNNLPAATKSRIQDIPLTPFEIENLEFIENSRRQLDIESCANECLELVKAFNQYAVGKTIDEIDVLSIVPVNNRSIYSLFSAVNEWTVQLSNKDGGAQWFNHFMTDWIFEAQKSNDLSTLTENGSIVGNHLIGGDLYTDSLFRLNIMAKLTFGRCVVRNLELTKNGVNSSKWSSDEYRMEQLEMAQRLSVYVFWMDLRNMGIFPANDSLGNPTYIPEDNYFLMGDNRFNSLDMRHSYSKKITPLYPEDNYSIIYSSMLDPQYVSRSRIEGKASFRIWPFSHLGAVK